MKTSTLVVIVLAVVAVMGGWYWYTTQNTAAPAAQTQTTAQTNTQADAPMTATVSYSPGGFSPASITITQGGTVTFVAASGADEMWVASDPHPTHQGYDGTTKQQHCAAGYAGAAPFDQCAAGTTFTFTFSKTGTWGYHNHGNSSKRGSITVVAQ